LAKRASGKTLSRPLSGEEVAKFTAAAEEMTRARAVIDRTLAHQLGIPAGKPRRVKNRRGRSYDYDVPEIIRITKELLAGGVDDHLAWTIDRVRMALPAKHVKEPKATRLRQIVKPIYDHAKAERDAARSR
jgi:hypothetical protein